MSLEFNTKVDYIYQGGDAIFSIPFPYINKSHILVAIDGDIENPTTNFTWLSETQIRLDDEINTGVTVSIMRVTPIDYKMVVFTDNNILDEETQNLAQDQVFNVVQEIKDNQDELNANLDVFVNIQDAINDQMQIIQAAAITSENSIELLENTQELVNDISNTYQDLKEQVNDGIRLSVTHNLFAIEVFDKKLSDEETEGLAQQNTEVNYANYPDAFLSINQEFNEGTTKIYQDSDVAVINKKIDLENSDSIYSSNVDLVEGVEVFSDETLLNSLGVISNYSELEVDNYLLTENITNVQTNAYVNKETILSQGTNLYSDKLLTTEIGSISEIKDTTVNKYTASADGVFYMSTDTVFMRGKTIYSDSLLTQPKGVLSYVGTIDVDQYSIAGASFDKFYVPKGTEVGVGTEIFSDSTLTTSLGVITTKGITSSDTSYYYSYAYGNNLDKIDYFYTKEKIPTVYTEGLSISMYVNRLCTEYKTLNGSSAKITGVLDQGVSTTGYGLVAVLNGNTTIKRVKLISSSDVGSGNAYLCLQGSNTKYTYYKQATLEGVSVIAIDEGGYQGYSVEGQVSNTFIKVNDVYYIYEKIDTVTSQVIKIKDSNEEESTQNVIAVSLITTNGVLFEYKEHPNGHKIVSSIYASQLEAYKQANEKAEYYLLDKTNKTLILPLLNLTKEIYFVVGNTKIINAGITYDERILESTSQLVDCIWEVISNIYKMLGAAQQSVEEIIEEL